MRVLLLIPGFLLALLGAIWTYLGFAPPNPDGDIGYVVFGPIALLLGIALLFLGFPWGEADDKPKSDTAKDRQ